MQLAADAEVLNYTQVFQNSQNDALAVSQLWAKTTLLESAITDYHSQLNSFLEHANSETANQKLNDYSSVISQTTIIDTPESITTQFNSTQQGVPILTEVNLANTNLTQLVSSDGQTLSETYSELLGETTTIENNNLNQSSLSYYQAGLDQANENLTQVNQIITAIENLLTAYTSETLSSLAQIKQQLTERIELFETNITLLSQDITNGDADIVALTHHALQSNQSSLDTLNTELAQASIDITLIDEQASHIVDFDEKTHAMTTAMDAYATAQQNLAEAQTNVENYTNLVVAEIEALNEVNTQISTLTTTHAQVTHDLNEVVDQLINNIASSLIYSTH